MIGPFLEIAEVPGILHFECLLGYRRLPWLAVYMPRGRQTNRRGATTLPMSFLPSPRLLACHARPLLTLGTKDA